MVKASGGLGGVFCMSYFPANTFAIAIKISRHNTDNENVFQKSYPMRAVHFWPSAFFC
jgi:hypothetical protein